MGASGTGWSGEDWSLKRCIPDTPWIFMISITSLLVLAAIAFMNILAPESPYIIFIILSPLPFCFIGLGVIAWNGSVYHDYAYMSHRKYPSEVRVVETAIGLLLISKDTKFDKEVRTWRLRTRMQVVYSVRKMDGNPMVIEVRPLGRPETSGTQVRIFHDIEVGKERRTVEETFDDAISNPFKLQLRKYHLEEEPDLHVLER